MVALRGDGTNCEWQSQTTTTTTTTTFIYTNKKQKSSTLIMKLKSKVLAAYNNHKG